MITPIVQVKARPLGAGDTGVTATSAAAAIPAGCPGSTQAGPPSVDCSKIPLGCPGSTQQGPVAATPTNCSPVTSTSGTPAATTSGLTDCGTNASANADTKLGVDCIPNTADKAFIGVDTNSTLIDRYLNPLIKLLSVLVAVAVTFGVIYGGIQYSMSAGDPQKAASGRKHIRDAVIALVAYALALAFLNFLIPGGILV